MKSHSLGRCKNRSEVIFSGPFKRTRRNWVRLGGDVVTGVDSETNISLYLTTKIVIGINSLFNYRS